MAYTASGVASLISRMGGGVALFAYASVDAIATVRGANYFTNAKDLGMKVGDLVAVTTLTGTTPSAVPTLCVVSAISAAGAATVL